MSAWCSGTCSHLGELNGRQEASWRKTVELLGGDEGAARQVALFTEEHAPEDCAADEWPVVRGAAFADVAAPAAAVGRVPKALSPPKG